MAVLQIRPRTVEILVVFSFEDNFLLSRIYGCIGVSSVLF